MQQQIDIRNNLLKEKFSNSNILTNEEKLRKEIELKIKNLTEKPSLLEKTINAQELNKLNDLNLVLNFNGMYHVMDHHNSAVTRIRFANNQKALFACSSTDSNLSVCQLLPQPATVIYTLKGHTSSVSDFDWSNENDLIVSCSFDCTVRLWCTKTSHCLRVITTDSPITVCLFQVMNNNMIIIGNLKGYLHVLNASTGQLISAGSVRVNTNTRIQCMTLDNDGKIVYVGDSKGFITSFAFDLTTGCLTRLTKCIVKKDASITSLSIKNYVYNNNAKGKFILVNNSNNELMIFRIDSEMKLRLKYTLQIKHQNKNLLIKSSFCPLASSSDNARLVSGSEDGQVYFYSNLDFFNTEDKKPDSAKLVKLQGHSAAILDVCFSYDESFLASSDINGTVIIWKKECSQS